VDLAVVSASSTSVLKLFAGRASPVAAAVASRLHVRGSDSRVDAGVVAGLESIWKVVASSTGIAGSTASEMIEGKQSKGT
jgi:hypothetical protein